MSVCLQIDRDVACTSFGGGESLGEEARQGMRRVLLAYATYNTRVSESAPTPTDPPTHHSAQSQSMAMVASCDRPVVLWLWVVFRWGTCPA